MLKTLPPSFLKKIIIFKLDLLHNYCTSYPSFHASMSGLLFLIRFYTAQIPFGSLCVTKALTENKFNFQADISCFHIVPQVQYNLSVLFFYFLYHTCDFHTFLSWPQCDVCYYWNCCFIRGFLFLFVCLLSPPSFQRHLVSNTAAHIWAVIFVFFIQQANLWFSQITIRASSLFLIFFLNRVHNLFLWHTSSCFDAKQSLGLLQTSP